MKHPEAAWITHHLLIMIHGAHAHISVCIRVDLHRHHRLLRSRYIRDQDLNELIVRHPPAKLRDHHNQLHLKREHMLQVNQHFLRGGKKTTTLQSPGYNAIQRQQGKQGDAYERVIWKWKIFSCLKLPMTSRVPFDSSSAAASFTALLTWKRQ